MSKDKLKHCIAFGCGKELPDGTKIPVCDYHKDKAKGMVTGTVAVAAGLGSLALCVVRKSDDLGQENSIQAQDDELFEGQDDGEDGNA